MWDECARYNDGEVKSSAKNERFTDFKTTLVISFVAVLKQSWFHSETPSCGSLVERLLPHFTGKSGSTESFLKGKLSRRFRL